MALRCSDNFSEWPWVFSPPVKGAVARGVCQSVTVKKMADVPSEAFAVFVSSVGDRVRRALVAFYGVEIGTEAAAEAISACVGTLG